MHRTTRQVRFELPRQLHLDAGVRTIHIDLSNIQKTAANNGATTATSEATIVAPPSPVANVTIQHGTTRYVNGVLQTAATAEDHRVKLPPLPTPLPAESLRTGSKLKSCLKSTGNGQPPSRRKSATPKPTIVSHTVYLLPSMHCKPAAAVEPQPPAATPPPNRPPPPPRQQRRRNVIVSTTSSSPNRLQVPLAGLSEDTHRDTEAAGKSSGGDAAKPLYHGRFQPERPAAFGQFLQLVTGSWRHGNGKVSSSSNGSEAPAMMTSAARSTRAAANGAATAKPSTEPPVRARVLKRSDVEKRKRASISSWPIVNRFRAAITGSNIMPPVPTLLRAAREADEDLLRAVLRDILLNGIPTEDLNATDVSGRTALSYICSTNLTHILDIFLQIPSLDINLADKEGNTPLHFAAQSGQSETVNMLLTRSRSIQIDAKNQLGFTPLMKAALQGRTRCAKLLLFAGASPVCVDSGRGFRAEQWARFCSRFTCAEMIETCARARLLDRGTSNQWAHDPHTLEKPTTSRTRTAPLADAAAAAAADNTTAPSRPANGNSNNPPVVYGIRSKLRKVFSFSLKERFAIVSSKKDRVQDKTDFSNYFTATKLCATGSTLPSLDDPKSGHSHTRPLAVPKLEVTPATNQSLIRKYEKLYGKDGTGGVGSGSAESDQSPEPSPKLPPRCKVRSRN